MEARAIAKGVRIAPRKARLVIDLIRGKSVTEADNILASLNKEASRLIRKVLNSATANAVNNDGAKAEDLFVKEAYINEGRTMKRGRAANKGRPAPILKRSSHITIVVSDEK